MLEQQRQLLRSLAPLKELAERQQLFAKSLLPAVAGARNLQRQAEAIARAARASLDTQALRDVTHRLREALPPNWRGLSEWEELANIARDDGIPVVWVPGTEILELLIGASDREARLALLLAHSGDVMDDCAAAIGEVDHPDLCEPAAQALQVISAFRDGHHAPAQSLAVGVTEALISEHIAQGRKYADVARDADVDVEELPLSELRTTFTLLPVVRFYTPWRKSWGIPPPVPLSRHVTVHHALADHLTPENAIVSVLLLTSILRDLQALLPGPPPATDEVQEN